MTAAETTITSARSPIPGQVARPGVVAAWLFAVCGMVYAIIVIGGITRLTESGLSMVEWRPLIGSLPPLSAAEWQRIFDLYRQTSEYQLANAGMTLDEFRAIFWWEYIHRVWGRLIGLAFGVPFLVFLVRGWVRGGFAWRLFGFLLLGALQGFMGWYMVRSGFVDRTDVSQYRLVMHLSLALLILGLLFWTALDLLRGTLGQPVARHPAVPWLLTAFGLVCLAIVSGGFVAGLDAGLLYNSFPLMGGQLVPEDYWGLGPALLNAFEHPSAAQFHHRVIAVGTVLFILFVALRFRTDQTVKRALGSAALVACLQAGLGIATLVSFVALPIAVLHQAVAALLFLLVLNALHRSAKDPGESRLVVRPT